MNEIISADHAHKIDQRIKNLRYSIDNSFLDLAKALKEVKENKLYTLLDYKTFESYIAQPELAFDRASVYRFIQIYDKFIGEYNVAPGRLLEAGWAKLKTVIPHVNEHNYNVMLEKATTLSRSDLDKDLVEQGFIVKSEPSPEFTDCPFCHKSFEIKNRRSEIFPQEDYKRIINTYIKVKDIHPKGNEYAPIQQNIKTMFLNGRIPDEIIAVINWMGENADYEWTINTVKNKIAEISPQLHFEPIKEVSEQDKKLLKIGGIVA